MTVLTDEQLAKITKRWATGYIDKDEVDSLLSTIAAYRERLEELREYASKTDINGDWYCWCHGCCSTRTVLAIVPPAPKAEESSDGK